MNIAEKCDTIEICIFYISCLNKRIFTPKKFRIISRPMLRLSSRYRPQLVKRLIFPLHTPISSRFFEMVSIRRLDSACNSSSSLWISFIRWAKSTPSSSTDATPT